jgi:hypothetical protein
MVGDRRRKIIRIPRRMVFHLARLNYAQAPDRGCVADQRQRLNRTRNVRAEDDFSDAKTN